VEPARPEIQPIGPDRPDIQQPEPMTHPGMKQAVAESVGEKSFFDEI
jgi:cell division initiation protein